MMLPMEVTDTPVTNDGTEEIRRKKRSVRQDQDILFAVRSNLFYRIVEPHNMRWYQLAETSIYLCYL